MNGLSAMKRTASTSRRILAERSAITLRSATTSTCVLVIAPLDLRSYGGFRGSSNAEFVAALSSLENAGEQVVAGPAALGQALLVRIAGDGFHGVPVPVGKTVFPRIAAEHLLLLVPGLEIPGERHNAWVFHPAHGDGLRALEGMEQVDRNPGMAVDDFLPDAHHVHDREDLRLLEEPHLL